MTTAAYQRTADVPISDLTPFPGNAKRGDVQAIRASLRHNGQYRSLIVREPATGDGPLVVLAGNHTLRALTEEGHPTARCEIVRCDDDTATRINLADNRTSDLGTYDNAALLDLLHGLDDYDGTGFTDPDVTALIEACTAQDASAEPGTLHHGGGDPSEASADPGDDDGPAPPPSGGDLLALAGVTVGEPKHQVETGQVWRLGPHRLIVASVFDGWHLWSPYLTEQAVFLPYPTLLAPFAERVRGRPMVMVQPERYLAGHLLDKWVRISGHAAELEDE